MHYDRDLQQKIYKLYEKLDEDQSTRLTLKEFQEGIELLPGLSP